MPEACPNLIGLDAKIDLGSLKVLVKRIIQFLPHAVSQVTTMQTSKTKKRTSTAKSSPGLQAKYIFRRDLTCHWPTAQNHWNTLLLSALQQLTWSQTFSRCWWNLLICYPMRSLREVFLLCLRIGWAHLSLSQEQESCGLPICNKQEQACSRDCVMLCW